MNLFKKKKSPNNMILKIVGGAALVAVAAGVLMSLPDIKRYIKISTM